MSRKIIGLNSNIIHRITALLNENLESRNSEFLISEFILKNIDEVSHMGIEELAENSYTSASTVSRYIKRLGYSNYLQFKRELVGFREFKQNEFKWTSKNNQQLVDEIFEYNFKCLSQLESAVNLKQLENVVSLINQATEVYIFGIDYSQIMAQDLQLRFVNNEKIIFSYIPSDDYQKLTERIKENSLVIFISVSGNTQSLLSIQKYLSLGVKQVLITENIDAELGEEVEELILLPKHQDQLVSTALSERQLILTIFDILYIIYANTY